MGLDPSTASPLNDPGDPSDPLTSMKHQQVGLTTMCSSLVARP